MPLNDNYDELDQESSDLELDNLMKKPSKKSLQTHRKIAR